MNQDDDLSEFEKQTRAVLRTSVDNLDGATRSRLTQARHAALAQHGARYWYDFRYLAPAGGAMAAVVLATILFIGHHGGPVNETNGGALDDMELLADNDAYELSQETDLEFIEWAATMGEQDQAGT